MVLLKGPVEAQDEGVSLADVDSFNFAGAGVTAAVSGKTATVTIPGASGATFDPTTTASLYDDFVTRPISPSAPYGWSETAVGAGSAISQIAGDASHFGVIQLSTGTTTTGLANRSLGGGVVVGIILFGGGVMTFQTLINIPTLSTAGEEYDIIVGMIDGTAGTHVDGAYFKYDRNTSVNWLRGTASNSVVTETDSGTVVATGWTTLKIVVNAAATSIEYFVNGVSVGSNTTNIPTAAGREVGICWEISKSAGTTARLLNADYVTLNQTFTTAR